jgi:hypothetical protein
LGAAETAVPTGNEMAAHNRKRPIAGGPARRALLNSVLLGVERAPGLEQFSLRLNRNLLWFSFVVAYLTGKTVPTFP